MVFSSFKQTKKKKKENFGELTYLKGKACDSEKEINSMASFFLSWQNIKNSEKRKTSGQQEEKDNK